MPYFQCVCLQSVVVGELFMFSFDGFLCFVKLCDLDCDVVKFGVCD